HQIGGIALELLDVELQKALETTRRQLTWQAHPRPPVLRPRYFAPPTGWNGSGSWIYMGCPPNEGHFHRLTAPLKQSINCGSVWVSDASEVPPVAPVARM